MTKDQIQEFSLAYSLYIDMLYYRAEAIQKGEKIEIYSDYDTGISALYVLGEKHEVPK